MSTTAIAIPASIEVLDSQAERIITKYTWGGTAAGLIPFPWLDLATVAAIQLKMLSDLSKVYHIEFSKQRAKALIGALIGGIAPGQLAATAAGGFVKMIPVVGWVTVPIFAGAVTYAVGKVFNQHFASGGTFLDFDPVATRSRFNELLEQGKKTAAEK
jgi:uncharacterized protein (DUF697 family)